LEFLVESSKYIKLDFPLDVLKNQMSNLDLKNAAFGTCFAQSAKYEIIKNIVV